MYLRPGLRPCCLATLISLLTLFAEQKTEPMVIIMGWHHSVGRSAARRSATHLMSVTAADKRAHQTMSTDTVGHEEEENA